MNNRRVILVAAALLVVVGLVVVLTLRALATRSGTATTPPPVAAADAPAVDSADPAPQAATADEAPPPWLQQDATGATADRAPQAAAADALRAQQLQQLQQSIRGVAAAASLRAKETNAHLRQALDTLEAMNDPAVTSQIDLPAVRRNLEISIQMQDVAQELQQLMQQADSPERRQQMEAKMARIRQLQTQMDPDVRTPGSTLPPLTPATLPATGG